MTKDPHFDREKQKYSNPIPSREFILELIQQHKNLLTRAQIETLLALKTDEHKEALRRRLRAMERDGEIVFTKQGYDLPERMDLKVGYVIGHRDGYGFFNSEGQERDLLIKHRCMHQYMHGDKVMVQPLGFDRKGRQECKIIRLVESRPLAIVGRYMIDNEAFVVPKDSRIFQEIMIPKDARLSARHGDIVVIELTKRATHTLAAQGKVIEVLGEENTPGMEIDIALRNHDLPHTWNARIDKLLRRIGTEVSDKEKVDRVDLRKLPLVTIDGEDARDFDDAVCAEPLKSGGFKLWVAIADVSHYVKKGSALDVEAHARGNSVYFPSQVIPMLPEQLSNGLCSLNPHVDRLCMVCEMQVSSKGELSKYKFYPAVMHSHARLTYTEVAEVLDDEQKHPQLKDILPSLKHLHALHQTLDQAREQRGALSFDTQETQFIFNRLGRIEKIVPRERNIAHKMIEECMILTNVAAASFVLKHRGETLYRVHQSPSEEKLMAFHSFLAERGLSLRGGLDPSPKDYANFMETIVDRPDRFQIQTLLLRSMKQAVYSATNEGHFGLSLPHYAHFTSPIRRYPDLQLHREIRYLLAKETLKDELKENWTSDGGYLYSLDELDVLGDHCSMTERRADDATREVSDWLKCEYMQDHIGQEFDAEVASVTSFGFFARLKDLFIDGLVHITNLNDDYYQYDPQRQILMGERKRRVFRVGDTVRVRVISVNMDDKQIDFVLHDSQGIVKKHPKKARSKKTQTGNGKNIKKEATKSTSKSKSIRAKLQDGSFVDSKAEKKRKSPSKKKSTTKKPRTTKNETTPKKRVKRTPKMKKNK